MSVGCCQLRNGVVWNAEDCRKAEAEIRMLTSVYNAADGVWYAGLGGSKTEQKKAMEAMHRALARYDRAKLKGE